MPALITAQVRQMLQRLEAERKRLDEQIAALRHVVTLFDGRGAQARTTRAAPRTQPRTRRRGMSAQARRAASARMKA